MNECNIVRDLLPLYADELASPDSAEFIGRHTAWCKDCNAIWKRINEKLPDVDPIEEAKSYKKGLRRAKRKLFFKSLALCLVVVAIAAFFIYYEFYKYGVYPISYSFPSPDGSIILEVVEKEDAPIFYTDDGLMVRMNLRTEDDHLRGLNRHSTHWDSLTAHWSQDSKLVALDVTTNDGEHAIFLIDASLEDQNAGVNELPGITENLIPVFEEALCSVVDVGELTFTVGGWCDDGETAYFKYEMEDGCVGTIDYHYPTGTITSIR